MCVRWDLPIFETPLHSFFFIFHLDTPSGYILGSCSMYSGMGTKFKNFQHVVFSCLMWYLGSLSLKLEAYCPFKCRVKPQLEVITKIRASEGDPLTKCFECENFQKLRPRGYNKIQEPPNTWFRGQTRCRLSLLNRNKVCLLLAGVTQHARFPPLGAFCVGPCSGKAQYLRVYPRGTGPSTPHTPSCRKFHCLKLDLSEHEMRGLL